MGYNHLEARALNIIVGIQYLTEEQIRELSHSVFDYGVFDIEFIADMMVNYKPTTSWLFRDEGRRFFDRCRFFLSYFRESVEMMDGLGVYARHFVPGYCPTLELPHRLDERDKSIDILFFGNVDGYRKPILSRIAEGANVVVRTPNYVTPLFMRNAQVAQSRIVLSLGRARPFTHIGPMRVVAMAHQHAFILSETPKTPQPELDDLCAFWEPECDPLEAVRYWLASGTLRRRRAEQAYERIRQRSQLSVLADALGNQS